MIGFVLCAFHLLVSFIPSVADAAGCPNEALRAGPSAFLPDCRAYELVTPPGSDGRLFAPPSSTAFIRSWDQFPTELASPAGDSVTFMTYGTPLAEPADPTGVFDVYQAQRSAGGWETTRHLTPAGTQSTTTYVGAVSAEGGYEFVNPIGSTPGLPGGSLAQEAAISDYLSKPDGSFEFTATGSLASEPYGQGRYISPGGKQIIFSTGHDEAQSTWCQGAFSACKVKQLEPNAPSEGTGAVYDREADGPTHVVSLLPGDKTPAAGEQAFYQGVSKDGTVIAFKIGGVLYVRVNDAETEEVATGEPTYAGLSEDGEFIYYVKEGDVHRFDTASKVDVQVNSSGDAELVNVSGDGSHAYFISKSQLDGSKGTAGQPNLYAWSGGPIEYVATVAPSDLEETSGTGYEIPALTRWTSYAVAPMVGALRGPGADSSRTTPDGSVLVFESKARLTSYENAGHTEIYRYDAQSKGLTCVSCNPSAEPATGDARLQEVIQLAEAPIAIHNLSDDGSRVFFETEESLVEHDTDGINDIYEWREEEGSASVDLISSGESAEYPTQAGKPIELPHFPLPNTLFSATPSGDDVVFLSQDALVPAAGVGGVPAIYDARVNGGFPEPAAPKACREEECRPPTSSPPLLSGSFSETTAGVGNVKPRHHRARRCRRAKQKRRQRCVKAAKRRVRALAATASQTGGEAQGSSNFESVEGGSAAGLPVPGRPQTASLMTSSGGEFEEFGIEAVGASETTSAAGMHPDFTTLLALNHFVNKKTGLPEANARAEDISVALPSGLVGNPNAFPRCSTGLLIAFGNCPTDSQVGIAKILPRGVGSGFLTEPVYNLEVPNPGKEIARLGFVGLEYPVYIDVHVRTAGDYGVTATVEDSPGLVALLEAETILWGDPPDPSHDEERLTASEAVLGCTTACKAPGGKRESTLPPTAFMSNPSACQSGEVGFAVTSYQLPGQVFSKSAPLAPITNCSGLPFEPSFEATPTNHTAGAPTGLKTSLKLPQSTDPEVPATATMREARVTLPAGMGINPSAADGLAACSEAQVGFHEEVDAACPDASKLGTATITSPDLPEPIEGALYQRSPEPGHQFRLWLVSDALGLHIKLPGEIKTDPNTGQLTAIFSDLPQVPVEEIDFNVWGGSRAPLVNPESCGTYSTAYAFTPHSNDAPVSGQSQMTIDEGCNPGFSPKLHAGVVNPVAGAFSPFVFDLTREEGEQGLRGFELTLPEGELAKLKGVLRCPDAQAASGDCPAASKIGSVTVAAGAGPDPLWLPQPGKAPTAIYLAGPYEGAPFSIVTTVPAQAGPFDLGTVAVRSALEIDPESARATVKADPLPRFVEGVPVIYRRLHAVIDRPEFSLNPTDCRELSVSSRVTSAQGSVAEPANRFQVDGCKALGFKPKLSMKLRGGTERGDFPALTATLKTRPGDANIGRTSVNLPPSEFLAQSHIGTICTRVRFAAHDCPTRSVYGYAKAWTPLLDKPLEGPVYLRANGGERELPDLVAALGGELEVDLVGYIDSHRLGIRTTFAAVPDAPVSRFVLKMRGGAKGLLENHVDLCRRKHRAAVAMRAQNGRALVAKPVLASPCGKSK